MLTVSPLLCLVFVLCRFMTRLQSIVFLLFSQPTKDRAKKPKKNKGQGQGSVQSNATQSSLSATSTSIVPTPLPSGNGLADRRPLTGIAQSHTTFPPQPVVAPTPPPSKPISSGGGSGMVGRRALPGMTQTHSIPSVSPKPVPNVQYENVPAPRPLPGLATTSSLNASQKDDTPSFVSGVHSRIPSTGSRPTAMDVAQAFADPPSRLSPNPPPADDRPAESNSSPTPRPRNVMPPTGEKRKSSYERYSVILPPLKEEATPDPTPVSTLTRAVGNSFAQPDFDLVDSKLFDRNKDVEEVRNVIEPKDEIMHFSMYPMPHCGP